MTDKKTTSLYKILNTPLSISVYSVETSPTQMHEAGILEIILCLKGSVKFTYAYEEYTLHAGEYISVDKDAYYLYDGKDNVCVSFYIDLTQYAEKYPFIINGLFVCEGLAETTMPFPTEHHKRLKGLLISTLKTIAENIDATTHRAHIDPFQKELSLKHIESSYDNISCMIKNQTDKIVDLFIKHFDIISFHTGLDIIDEDVAERIHTINDYMWTHLSEKLTINNLAEQLNLTEGYISEYIRRYSIGFRGMLGYIRANSSEQALIKTDKTIIEISEECGFSDPKYYYSAFKRWYKCTPNQFRKKYSGNQQERHIEYIPIEQILHLIDKTLMEHYKEIFLYS